MRKFFTVADYVVMHNGVRWDIPNLERVLGIKIKTKCIDSLALSWYLYPDRKKKHGLEAWGEEFGIKKPPITDWTEQPLSTYVHRCQEDVKINVRLWKNQWTKLLAIYRSEKEVFRFLDYLEFKMQCARLAEESGWKVDVEYCEKSLIKLIEERKEKVDTLTKVMPKVPIVQKKQKPKRLVNKDGALTKMGTSWYELIESQSLPKNTEETEIILGYEDGNPNSPHQIKDWLFSLGWKPQTFKTNKKKEEIPQINLEFGRGICDSIKDLYEKEPHLDVLDGLSVLNHRIPILQKFLRLRDSNDEVKARVQGLTNTLRFQHADPCVNMPKPEKRYAEAVRGSLIAKDGYKLLGADMSSLEDRLKQHFIFPLDPEYVRSMIKPDFDPHLTLAVIAGMMTQAESDFYKKIEHSSDEEKRDLSKEDKNLYKKLKTLRGIAKNGNYALQYGAYPPRLVKTCGLEIKEAQNLFDSYWKLNWAIKTISSTQKVQKIAGEMWLLNPISGFYYSLRNQSDVFSTLIQGTASYVFDMWVKNVLEERRQLTAQFHDEIVVHIKDGSEDRMTDLCFRAIHKLNSQLKLNRELDIGVQVGIRYSDIH